ncbi:MAG: hypothetical protein O3A25_19675, partial [Acidobacteria bacterium]|nr:hypothetical protein [Acidobacteriota bacterium]
APVLESQVSSVHTLASSQALDVPAWQAPPAQISTPLQASPSLQTFAAPPTHLPPLQLSPLVQASPSSQAPALGLWVQPPVAPSQPSLVHALLSSLSMVPPGLDGDLHQEVVHAQKSRSTTAA